jgi:2-polyprenyl-3-methyl-5-hydroxy-6-metoxy-1,4-benzoquinol methylase
MKMDPLVEYYSQRATEYEEIYERDDPVRRRELAEIDAQIRRTFANRRVLEIACGTGFWTRVVTEVAETVVATDASSAMLELAREKISSEKSVKFAQASAYDLGSVEGNFDAALANFWLSHVPRSQLQQFIAQLHARIGSGSVVFMADNINVPGVGGEFVTRNGCEDTYKIRQLKDGSKHQIIKNYFDANGLRQMLTPHCSSEPEVHCGQAYWWVRYCVS